MPIIVMSVPFVFVLYLFIHCFHHSKKNRNVNEKVNIACCMFSSA